MARLEAGGELMEEKFEYFIDRTDDRLEKMEETLKAIKEAVVMMQAMQAEVNDLKLKVHSLIYWRARLAGGALVVGAVGGFLANYVFKK